MAHIGQPFVHYHIHINHQQGWYMTAAVSNTENSNLVVAYINKSDDVNNPRTHAMIIYFPPIIVGGFKGVALQKKVRRVQKKSWTVKSTKSRGPEGEGTRLGMGRNRRKLFYFFLCNSCRSGIISFGFTDANKHISYCGRINSLTDTLSV